MPLLHPGESTENIGSALRRPSFNAAPGHWSPPSRVFADRGAPGSDHHFSTRFPWTFSCSGKAA